MKFAIIHNQTLENLSAFIAWRQMNTRFCHAVCQFIFPYNILDIFSHSEVNKQSMWLHQFYGDTTVVALFYIFLPYS